jgi:hypothetical protein
MRAIAIAAAVFVTSATAANMASAQTLPSADSKVLSTAVVPDPGTPGPLATTRTSYNFGDTAFAPPGFGASVEIRAEVTYPTTLPGGPLPLIILAHGRHSTCYVGGSASLQWPCPVGTSEIPSYQGYRYLADNLASWGFIVASIGLNGVNAHDNSVGDLGALARAQVIQNHLDRWKTWGTTGAAPFGDLFAGHVDMTKIGEMGHSRGGEGVGRSYIYNLAQPNPYGIKAILPLAPTDFSRWQDPNVHMDVILPYCDGDVSDLQGVHFYDDVRNTTGDLSAKQYQLVMGANHNFFNTIWTPGGWPAGTADDWLFSGSSTDPTCGASAPATKRLSQAGQRAVGLAYMAGFFRAYLKPDPTLVPLFDGSAPQPASIGTAEVHRAYQAPDTATTRFDVNRLLTAANLTTDTAGGAVSQVGVTPYTLCGGNSPQPQHCLAGFSTAQQPHTTPSFLSGLRGLSSLQAGWNALTATWTNGIPAGAINLTGFDSVNFRAVVNFGDARNPVGSARDLDVQLTDGAGNTATAQVSAFSNELYYPPGTGSSGPIPKIVLSTIRLPLSAFAGVALNDVRSIKFLFDRNATGALLISDLSFVKPFLPSSGGGTPPTVTSANPNSRGQGAKGSKITIKGTGFTAADTVSFSGTGITVKSVTFISPTSLKAVIDVATNAPVGLRNVVVTDPSAGAGTCVNCFQVNLGPHVTSVSPNSGARGAVVPVTVNGSNFVAGLKANFGAGIVVSNISLVSGNQFTCDLNIGAGAATGFRTVKVTNSDGGIGKKAKAFTVT